MEVHSYKQCGGCGEWLPDTETRPAPQLCPQCSRDAKALIDGNRLAYEVEGRKFTTKPQARKKPKKRAKQTPEQHENRKAWERARMRTLVRLAEIYRPMYELIFAEEKIREGLDPTMRHCAPRPKAIAADLIADIEDARERHGRTG